MLILDTPATHQTTVLQSPLTAWQQLFGDSVIRTVFQFFDLTVWQFFGFLVFQWLEHESQWLSDSD